MTNAQRREIIDNAKARGYQGSYVDLFRQAAVDPQQVVRHGTQASMDGLRPAHQAGNTEASMAFTDVPPNTPFNTIGMKKPIDIKKYDRQGHLVKSYESVPPGIQSFNTGPSTGTVIETPARMQEGGYQESVVEDLAEMLPGVGTILSLDDAYYAAKDMIKNPGKVGFNKRTASNVLDMVSLFPGGKATSSILAATLKAGDKVADLGRVRHINKTADRLNKAGTVDDLADSISEEYSRWSLPPSAAPKPLTPRPPKKLLKQDIKQDRPGGMFYGGRYSFQKGGARKDEDYNMKRALELGYKPDEDGHYPSVDHETGMLLKSKQHPTVKLEFMSQMLSPDRKLIANPTGYFGENQLQYVDRKQGGDKDPVVGTGKKPKGSGRRLYTDENPKDTVSIKFATPTDARATVSKVKNINKPFARKIQILTVGEQRAKVMGKTEVASIFRRGKEAIRKSRRPGGFMSDI